MHTSEPTMNPGSAGQRRARGVATIIVGLLVVAAIAAAYYLRKSNGNEAPDSSGRPRLKYEPEQIQDMSGFFYVLTRLPAWPADADLDELHRRWDGVGYKTIALVDEDLAKPNVPIDRQIALRIIKATLFNCEGEPEKAYELLTALRSEVEANDVLAEKWLYSVIFAQAVTSLRRGETENCIRCRGESSCILPIVSVAVHQNEEGSRLAIKHCTEYLAQFPNNLEVRWLLNLAHMTLGEHPAKVDPKYLVSLDHFTRNEFDIGRFRDVGHLAGVNRFNQAGGAIMEDFDGDGLLDIVITSWDNTQSMAYYRNKGDGTFEDATEKARLTKQRGGLFCVQADYNNDGRMDIFIARGAWIPHPMRPSLLRNNGDGTFTDVTKEAGLIAPVNSNSACWADFDNDGYLDLFIACERQPNKLYRNKGDGTFEEVAAKAGVAGDGKAFCKGATWIDYDNDGYPDLYLANMAGGQLFHNNRDGTFTDVTKAMGISGPEVGFSCWAFDFDNDGWLDIFATSYDRTLEDLVKGLLGQPHHSKSNRLYRNIQGKGFVDVTKEMGLDTVFATMGSNFADFDNDGYLDFYLGTGDPNIATLVPNRMFKNVGGKRFSEITASSGTGHLQKGHAIACGDWRRTGQIDIFMETGGAVNGDRYHNVLFMNPGHANHWLTVKLVGKKTNRAAIGARIKAVTDGEEPLMVHRHVSSGSSFGANPLQQTLGLGKAKKVALLEVQWPTSGTTQIFRNIDVDQAIEITEFEKDYRKLNWTPVAAPK
jgi:hypothetical protein